MPTLEMHLEISAIRNNELVMIYYLELYSIHLKSI